MLFFFFHPIIATGRARTGRSSITAFTILYRCEPILSLCYWSLFCSTVSPSYFCFISISLKCIFYFTNIFQSSSCFCCPILKHFVDSLYFLVYSDHLSILYTYHLAMFTSQTLMHACTSLFLV